LQFEIDINHDGAGGTSWQSDISTGTFYDVQVKWNSDDDTYEWKLGGTSQNSGSLTSSAAGWSLNKIYMGAGAAASAAAMTMYIDNVLISTSGYPNVSAGGPVTATVTTSAAHGLVVGDVALIEGATQEEYNGAFTVLTVPSTTTFTYTAPGTPTTPATGTIKVTGGYFNETTGSTGILTDSRSIATSQPMTGWVRKTSATPYYRTSGMDFTVDKDSGYTITVPLISDE
jgi:hypothetical protein